MPETPRRPRVARPIEPPPVVIPVDENAPVPRDWFYARFLDYLTNRERPNFRLRFLYASHPDQQRNPRWVGEAIRDIILASEDEDDPNYRLAKALIELPMPAGPRRVPRALAPNGDVWCREAWVRVADMPADFEEAMRVPNDIFLSRVHFDGDRLCPVEPYADTPKARRKQRIDQAFASGGVPVRAVLVQANHRMFEDGDEDWPGALVFTPDPTVSDDLLEEVSKLTKSIKGTRQDDPDLARLSAQVTNEIFVEYRRQRVPTRFTDGEEVYLADVELYRSYLRNRVVHGLDRLACVAEPGEYGALELLPESRGL